jgi:superfamily II DNA or RNA helicase
MSYFSQLYPVIKYPLGSLGLRTAQAGAIHSIAAHFSVHDDPSLVVMPTGSGKTGVLLASPFVLRAKRALIITPSRLVREQIVKDAKSLGVLKSAGVLPQDVQLPKVGNVSNKLGVTSAWNALKDFDFVVATPNCTSPGIDGVEPGPLDLFDLILIDEAHHAAAKTWRELIDHFQSARCILFTATPYRRDKRIIRARSIYTYPLRKAFDDGIFGKVNFVAVRANRPETNDEVIAKTAEESLRQDRASGFKHVLMVRTDSKKRARELKTTYARKTKLRLQEITSDHSAAFVEKSLDRLRLGAESKDERGLDGVICVNMMGEGFDFPQLKIAAIHSPHQSLAVTLQFIGRFARTAGPNIGEAKFIAVPEEISGEAEELFHEGAIWNEIVPNLSEARVAQEQRVREVIAGFSKVKTHHEEISDIEFDLGSLTPFCHVKVYVVESFSGFDEPPTIPKNFELVQYDVNEEHQCAILLMKERIRPRWTDYDELSKIEYEFVLVYYDEPSDSLFICASRRGNLGLYDAVGEWFSKGTHRLLALREINRVLHDLKSPTLFQVGMKNAVLSSNSESYQTKIGADVKNALTDSDGRLYHQGHVFLRGEEKGKFIAIGYSSGSKIWSNTTLRVPEIIDWCKKIGAKLLRTERVVTGTNLDFLDVGEPVHSLPEDVIGIDWTNDVYSNYIQVTVSGKEVFALNEAEIAITHRGDGTIRFTLSNDFVTWLFKLSLVNSCVLCESESDIGGVTVTRKDETFPLLSYLKDNHFNVYLSDFSRISGNSIFKSNSEPAAFSMDYVDSVDWACQQIDITKEFSPTGHTGIDNSIHGYLKRDLSAKMNEVTIYDHGSGEIADFLRFEDTPTGIRFSIYHCKGSGGDTPGERVGDVYEVAGQVVKSLIWLRTPDALAKKINFRLQKGSEFLVGDKARMEQMFTASQTKGLRFFIYLVQPGLSVSKLSNKLTGPMAAARDFVARSCRGEVRFLISP